MYTQAKMQARPKKTPALMGSPKTRVPTSVPTTGSRSEERRVGKEC